MSEIRNLEWLRNKVCGVLGVDPTNIDSAFQGTEDEPWGVIDDAINEAVEAEVAELQVGSDYERLLEIHDFTWPSSNRILVLPDFLAYADIVKIEDWTHTSPGTIVGIYSRNSGFEPEVSFLDRRTLQWGTAGPGEDKALRAFYIAEPAEMTSPLDEPRYIPPRFRWVIVWAAAIIARDKQGETYPVTWGTRAREWQERLHLAFSKGRPRDPNVPQQQASGGDSDWDYI